MLRLSGSIIKELPGAPLLGLGFWCLTPLSTIFPLYLAVSFIGGGKWWKPATCHKSLTNFIT